MWSCLPCCVCACELMDAAACVLDLLWLCAQGCGLRADRGLEGIMSLCRVKESNSSRGEAHD